MVSSAYETLRLAGRLDEAFPKTRPQSRRPTKRRKPYTDPGPEGWTPDAIMAEAKCHPTKDAFYIAAPDAFIAAARLRLLPEATAHMTK